MAGDIFVVPECHKCGECCQYVDIPVSFALTVSDHFWWVLHGFDLVKVRGQMFYRAKMPCSKLAKNGLCMIYPERPENCKKGRCIHV